jgi:hypothetical protein
MAPSECRLGNAMLTRSELPENPVALSIADDDGQVQVVTAERVRGGRVRIGCTCRTSVEDGWCRHQVQLLCMRYDGVEQRDGEAEFHFEDIVMGTPLADLADEVDLALGDFDKAVKVLEAAQRDSMVPDHLRRLAEIAAEVAEAASHLEGTLSRFKKKLAAAAE